ncbi:hypothetical protein R6Y95_06115 [Methanoculleus palmolei]|uniref:CopG family transcriptional regulator n=1 Tax=Methanoculleus palmolei TaxID=72612 RepID=A0ABD8A670_9EURY|nr:hypothetical protein R6Y95_06115 [Methanoculleus palmolei]
MTEVRTCFLADEYDLSALDEQIPYMGFTSRSEYLRACITVTVHGPALAEAAGKLDPVTQGWIQQMREHGDRRHDDEVALLEYIGKVGLPVIAMKGLKTAFKALKADMIAEMLRETGRVFSEDDMWRILNAYAVYHKVEIEEYRSKTAVALYEEAKTE